MRVLDELIVVCLCVVAARADDPATAAVRAFSMPIDVSGLPAGAMAVPVSCRIDFTAILEKLQQHGAVDERSLALVQDEAEGITGGPRPVQWLADPQPRPNPRLTLPGTSDQLSLSSEYAAGETPPLRVAGELWWLANADAEGRVRYRLTFAVTTAGRAVQVPYPPQNLRMFDAEGRATAVRDFPRMQLRPQWPLEGKVHVHDGAASVTTYHTGPSPAQAAAPDLRLRRPFFYPVLSPAGHALTEFGKPHDPTGSHRHHYSLWIAHNSVGSRNFWSDQGGVIAHEGFDLMEDGPVFCRLVQRTAWVFGEETLLRERRMMTFFPAREDGARLIDFDLEYSPGGDQPVELGQTTFGFLAVRVAQSMSVFDGGGEIRTSRGGLNEAGVHLTRAEWLDQSGPVASETWAGIALLDHPDNANHPTGWHCRNDGWAGAAFNMERPYMLRPGTPLRLRYRAVLHAGKAEEGGVAARYAEYAASVVPRLGDPPAVAP